MSLKLILSDEAVLDIEEAFLWYLAIEPKLADDFETLLYTSFNDILSFPNSFQKRYKNVRVRFLERFPYGVHYLTQDSSVIVVGVFHTSRNPKNWFNRGK